MVGYHVLAPPSPYPAVSQCGTSQKSLSRQALPVSFSVLVLQNFRSTKPDWLMLCRAPCEGPAPAGEGAGPQGGDNAGGGSPAKHKGLQRAAEPQNHCVHSQGFARQVSTSCGHGGMLEVYSLQIERNSGGLFALFKQPRYMPCMAGKQFPWPQAAGGAGSKTEGLGPFYLLPGEKGKYISRSCKASRISQCTGGEEEVGCPEAQTSSKLLDLGWEKLVSSGDGSAALWPNQPPREPSQITPNCVIRFPLPSCVIILCFLPHKLVGTSPLLCPAPRSGSARQLPRARAPAAQGKKGVQSPEQPI